MKGWDIDFDGVGKQFWETVALSGWPPNATEKKTRMGRGVLEKGVGVHHSFSHSGVHRKAADQIGRSPSCLTRVWAFVVTLACLFLLASVTPVGNSIQAKIFYPRKLVLSYPRDHGSSAQLLWELRTEEMFALSFNSLRQKNDGVAPSTTHPRSLTSHGGGTLTNPSSTGGQVIGDLAAASPPFIEDMVVLPEDLDLFIVRHGSSVDQERISACRYGGEPELKSVPRTVDFLPDGRLGVSCTRPSSLPKQKTLKVENVSLDVDSSVPILPHADRILKPARWDEALVYAVQSTDVDVVLYVKNLFDSSRRKATEYTELENFRCRFGEAVETPVTAGALEVFRCDFPSVNYPTTIASRVKVHLIYKDKPIRSVAYYEPTDLQVRAVAGGNGNSEVGSNELISSGVVKTVSPKKKHLVCSCTMIWNVAQFLKEWVLFNSDLGVEKFFLYDNNSEDDIRRAVSDLSEYNVTRVPWPWVKTQEAGFSNCAIEAQRECTWILFTDVDEYLFPKRWLHLTEEPESGRATARPELASPLATLIQDTLTKVTRHEAVGNGTSTGTKIAASSTPSPPSLQVGQISFQCRNFGPSGRTTNPPAGVTQGYTCRDQGEQRHKSLIYFPALKSSLQNVIHHFYLKPRHRTIYLDVRHAVVHHYKYQAWSEFEKKFAKRASTYVVDWKESKNLNSKDRPEGLGSEATKPPDWETSHCALNDTSLRDYTRRRYGVLGPGDDVKLAWEL